MNKNRKDIPNIENILRHHVCRQYIILAYNTILQVCTVQNGQRSDPEVN